MRPPRALLLEGFRVLEGVSDCLRHHRRDLDPPPDLVVGDLHGEGLEHVALHTGRDRSGPDSENEGWDLSFENLP